MSKPSGCLLCRWLRCLCGASDGAASPGKPVVPKYSFHPIVPRLLVFLGETIRPYSDDAADQLRDDPGWRALVARYGQLRLRRVFTADAGEIRNLINRATENAARNGVRGYQPLLFDHWFYVALPERAAKNTFDLYCDLKSWVQGRRGGGFVQVSLPKIPASPSAGYRQNAPEGIGAEGLVVNSVPINGAGQRVVDIEKAWVAPAGATGIEVIADPILDLQSGDQTDLAHGAATIGVVHGASANGIAGIAPAATFMCMPSLSTGEGKTVNQLIEAAILGAGVALSRPATVGGPPRKGVILIEQQDEFNLPIEAAGLLFHVIQQVAGDGHIVIEPAGNGNGPDSLDNVDGGTGVFQAGAEITRKLDGLGATSGAIVVAAGNSWASGVQAHAAKTPSSNFGRLIDCWAWGDSILTITASREGGQDVTIQSPEGYGDTSGAAAIVAGAVVLMQQMRGLAPPVNGDPPPPLTPTEVRYLLTTYGTLGKGELASVRMPDLKDTKMQARILSHPVIPPQNEPIG